MITKELLKEEIDRVQDKYWESLYKIIVAFENPIETRVTTPSDITMDANAIGKGDWHDFIEATYGCLANTPIERGEQGEYEIREVIV